MTVLELILSATNLIWFGLAMSALWQAKEAIRVARNFSTQNQNMVRVMDEQREEIERLRV